MRTQTGLARWLERSTILASAVWFVVVVALAVEAPALDGRDSAPASVWVGALVTVAGSLLIAGSWVAWVIAVMTGPAAVAPGAAPHRSATRRGVPVLLGLLLGVGLMAGAAGLLYPFHADPVPAPLGVEQLGGLAETTLLTGALVFCAALALTLILAAWEALTWVRAAMEAARRG